VSLAKDKTFKLGAVIEIKISDEPAIRVTPSRKQRINPWLEYCSGCNQLSSPDGCRAGSETEFRQLASERMDI
jgi:hypothetical protein